jgi:hypothetical protein
VLVLSARSSTLDPSRPRVLLHPWSIHFHAYAGNNPLCLNDPLGLEPPAVLAGLPRDPEAGVVTGGFYIAAGHVFPTFVGGDRGYAPNASLDQMPSRAQSGLHDRSLPVSDESILLWRMHRTVRRTTSWVG